MFGTAPNTAVGRADVPVALKESVDGVWHCSEHGGGEQGQGGGGVLRQHLDEVLNVALVVAIGAVVDVAGCFAEISDMKSSAASDGQHGSGDGQHGSGHHSKCLRMHGGVCGCMVELERERGRVICRCMELERERASVRASED